MATEEAPYGDTIPVRSGRRGPIRTRGARLVPGRSPQPLARALAVATVPLVLQFPAPRPVSSLLTADRAQSRTESTSIPAPSPDRGEATSGTGSRTAGRMPVLPPPRARPADAVPTATSAPSGSARASVPSSEPGGEVSSTLRAERLVLRGLRFHGVVTVHTAAGDTRVLEFTARSADAVGLDVTVVQGATTMRLRARAASTSLRKGVGGAPAMTFRLRELSGRLSSLGGAPLPADHTLALTPDAVPDWLAHSSTPTRTVTLTSATVSRFTQSGGELSLVGTHLRVSTK
ncbi:hypothetical protein EAO69_22310 [Streptomyces sp. me109]|uniref:hypothetical protein n=1 Tax=Streptomyces sp. me109 TaxID=1827853 RepID=UPI0011CD886B|nr:hypothetical protein [Streptomyces sp. me109]TXS71529.1 hypothetical protein EAO69_22310 [Streptomyces sp. me109]